MPRIELQYLMRPQTTPEQELFLTWFYSQFDNNAAAHQRILNVEPLVFMGATAGTEFLAYVNTKLYIALQLDINGGSEVAAVSSGRIIFNNEADAAFSYYNDVRPAWDTTAAAFKYVTSDIQLRNIYFSRFVITTYSRIRFIGYRITLN